MKTSNTIILDGDAIRMMDNNKSFSKKAREEHYLKVAQWASLLESQGFDVIVSVICAYKDSRMMAQAITGCSFIYLKGGKDDKDHPYEYEDNIKYFSK